MYKANIGGGCVLSGRMTTIDFKHSGREVFRKGITPVPCRNPSITGSGAGGSAVNWRFQEREIQGRRLSLQSEAFLPSLKGAVHRLLHTTEANAGDEGVLTTYTTVMPSPTPSKCTSGHPFEVLLPPLSHLQFATTLPRKLTPKPPMPA